MVHALEITSDLLTEGGILINIQPIGRPRPLEVHGGDEIRRAGLILHERDFADQRSSLQALGRARREGLFRLEDEEIFPFLYHAPSIEQFQDWLAKNSSTAILDQETVDRARLLARAIGEDSEVVMRETVYLGRLRPA